MAKFFDYSASDSFVNKMRSRRFDHFQMCMKQLPSKSKYSILDIGGTYSYWKLMGGEKDETRNITLLNLQQSPIPENAVGFSQIEGDIRNININWSEYDVVFSNSVIEHLGSYTAMSEFADRICSSGVPYYIQTPSFWFPLEPHCHLPFFQFLPRLVRAWMIWNFSINYFPRGRTYRDCLAVSDSTILLSKKKLKRLFPQAQIICEKFIKLPKSYTAIGGFNKSIPLSM